MAAELRPRRSVLTTAALQLAALSHPRGSSPGVRESLGEPVASCRGAAWRFLPGPDAPNQVGSCSRAMHQRITDQTGTRVFFCDAHSPWPRGSNENMNGLLRDYFPAIPVNVATPDGKRGFRWDGLGRRMQVAVWRPVVLSLEGHIMADRLFAAPPPTRPVG